MVLKRLFDSGTFTTTSKLLQTPCPTCGRTEDNIVGPYTERVECDAPACRFKRALQRAKGVKS